MTDTSETFPMAPVWHFDGRLWKCSGNRSTDTQCHVPPQKSSRRQARTSVPYIKVSITQNTMPNLLDLPSNTQ